MKLYSYCRAWWDKAQQQLIIPKSESKVKTKIRDLDISPGAYNVADEI